MAKEQSVRINSERKPIPTSPGPMQITNDRFQVKKGSSNMNSTMPKDVIPGPKGK